MLLKSRRSTRCPYLFRSTDLTGLDPDVLERTTWKSGDSFDLTSVDAERGAPRPEALVLVEVRDRVGAFDSCWDGDGVSKDREGKLFFQGAT
jgi:hypothetical protein